jgi:hypothetical protein
MSKESFICEGCNKLKFGKPKYKIAVGTDLLITNFYCSDECLEKTGIVP